MGRQFLSQSPGAAVLLVSKSGKPVLNIGLTAGPGAVLSSRPSHPTPAMNPFSRPARLILPPETAFRPGMVRFPLKMAAPFRSGCSMSTAGWLLRRSGWPMSGAGCSLARSWTEFLASGCSITGSGVSIGRSGRLPISRREHPGAGMEDPAVSMDHPGSASEDPAAASGHPKLNGTNAFPGRAAGPPAAADGAWRTTRPTRRTP